MSENAGMSAGTVNVRQVGVEPNSSTATAIASQPATKTGRASRRRLVSMMVVVETAAPV